MVLTTMSLVDLNIRNHAKHSQRQCLFFPRTKKNPPVKKTRSFPKKFPWMKILPVKIFVKFHPWKLSRCTWHISTIFSVKMNAFWKTLPVKLFCTREKNGKHPNFFLPVKISKKIGTHGFHGHFRFSRGKKLTLSRGEGTVVMISGTRVVVIVTTRIG